MAEFTWPPTLPQLKVEMKISDDRDNARMSGELAGAIAYVERVRAGQVDFTGTADPELLLDPVDDALCLGTIWLARRWLTRGRSPDMMLSAGEFGSVRVSSGDPDIDRACRIGRYAGPVTA